MEGDGRGMTAGTEPAETPNRLPRWRRALVATLVIVSVVLVPLAGLSIWVRNLVLDTNHYVDTVAPLAKNRAITDVVAKRATDRLFQEVDVEAEAKDALPERAQFLAGPLSSGVQTFAHTAVERALALSGNRRRTLMRWAIGIVAAMVVTAVLLALGRSAYLSVAQNHDAAAAAFDILVRFLRNGIRVIAALGIIVALAAFLSGPSRAAVWIR